MEFCVEYFATTEDSGIYSGSEVGFQDVISKEK
jgi:hypothetical protein